MNNLGMCCEAIPLSAHAASGIAMSTCGGESAGTEEASYGGESAGTEEASYGGESAGAEEAFYGEPVFTEEAGARDGEVRDDSGEPVVIEEQEPSPV